MKNAKRDVIENRLLNYQAGVLKIISDINSKSYIIREDSIRKLTNAAYHLLKIHVTSLI